MASSNPWDPVQPTAAGLMLARGLSAGVVSQRTLDICGKPSACFAHFSEAEQIADLQAEVSRINLETEALQMEKDTADIIHPFYLTQKCQALQAMNRHLDAVLKDKRALRQRLVKPLCRESLPIEAAFHRDVVELLALAVAFIEKLETHLLTVRSIPQIPENIKNMSSALAKMDLLVTETEELAEQILEWREKQKGIFENSQLTAGLDSSLKSIR
ncbi:HAUS augmin-like complex subunit 2 isoform X1 [Python bivittatus]|uniref:HAUS augmin-like complex subunit 2 isoform X1 n=1 Tax=Python bivittatus TaxID=176946 RepID=A0A9F2R3L9_PYTBI|nr:HAUS augmin-like complex subunit 2 isoform X1 [Python bivittatus]